MFPIERENIYGSRKRFDWILDNVTAEDTIVEFGCGTGSMITIPLAGRGFNIVGIDTDEASIAFGQRLAAQQRINRQPLQLVELGAIDLRPNVVIASEVFEHLPDPVLIEILGQIRSKLKAGGKLLVTVPNGYGWFEVESFLWFKAGGGWFVEKLRLHRLARWLKAAIGFPDEEPPLSTLSSCPHVQRFTARSIRALLVSNGFVVDSITGSVLVAGPFSNLFVGGISPLMRWNRALGDAAPAIASGFFVACHVTTSTALNQQAA